MRDSMANFVEALGSRGDCEWATGGGGRDTIVPTAREWWSAKFTVVEMNAWLDAGCFDASAAARLRDAGLTPEDAEVVVTSGQTIGYLVANGDMAVDAAVARAKG